ncbi:MAG: hypothetical protein AAB786_00840, partial [Patescibacteria group bacterium]
MNKDKPTILIIFGISGDLAKRYLLPAIDAIAKAKMLPEQFEIVGVTRQESSIYFQMNTTDIQDYKKLNEHLKKIEESFREPAQRLFYLSVPPNVSQSIVEFLGESGLSKIGDTKILLENIRSTNQNSLL